MDQASYNHEQESHTLTISGQKTRWFLDFPSGPVFKTIPSNAGGTGLTPGRGTKVPHAVWCGQIVFLKKMVSKSLMESFITLLDCLPCLCAWRARKDLMGLNIFIGKRKTQQPALEEFTVQSGRWCEKLKYDISLNPNTHISTWVHVNLENINFHYGVQYLCWLLTILGVYSRYSINISDWISKLYKCVMTKVIWDYSQRSL